jgi:hypothetical protein
VEQLEVQVLVLQQAAAAGELWAAGAATVSAHSAAAVQPARHHRHSDPLQAAALPVAAAAPAGTRGALVAGKASVDCQAAAAAAAVEARLVVHQRSLAREQVQVQQGVPVLQAREAAQAGYSAVQLAVALLPLPAAHYASGWALWLDSCLTSMIS